MKTIVKIRFFKPLNIESNGINVLVYELVDEKWFQNTIKSQRDLLSKLLVMAQNALSVLDSSGELREKYVYVEVEYPGLKASRVDGRVQGIETIVFPMPQPLKTIIFLKKENNELRETYKLFFKQEKWIYDSVITTSNIDFDALLVESIENKRVILREELASFYKKSIAKLAKKKKRSRSRRKKTVKRKHGERSRGRGSVKKSRRMRSGRSGR